MTDNKNKLIVPHSIILKERNVLTVSGVTDVDSFDEVLIVAYTDKGELTVCGENLKINNLNTQTGELDVEGIVNSLSYVDRKPSGRTFFSKVFR